MKTFLRTVSAIALFLTAIFANSSVAQTQKTASDFVKVRRTHFERAGKPYYFTGTNLWYGMNLGANAEARLVRELDRLQTLGVTNLRILAATEGPENAPWRIHPAVQNNPGEYSEELLKGLDFLLVEISKRQMTAVICLGNFWPWSGGMSQYLRWAGAGNVPFPPPEPGGSWSKYQSFTEKFYSNPAAVRMSLRLIEKIVQRKNTVGGQYYKNDPAIMAWELANEPRGGRNVGDFNVWIESTSRFIKSLDPNHLVTTGSEGSTPSPENSGLDLVLNHSYKSIDYATAHVWAQNWSWFDPKNSEATFPKAVSKMKAYIDKQIELAERAGKPIVFEEFGLGRDDGSFDPKSTTQYRDKYYREVFQRILDSAKQGSAAAGVNFWAWAGEATPKEPFGSYWTPGDPFLGDPPHEPQGWYSVYATDTSTIEVIKEFAKKLVNFPFFSQLQK